MSNDTHITDAPSSSPRWKKFLLWAAILYVVYVVVGFLVLPPIIKSQLLRLLPDATHRQATVRHVRLNPFTLSFQLEGLSLTETNGDVFASLEELYVNFQASSLFRWAWTFDELRLRRPYGHLVLQENGRFNFENLIPEPEEAEVEETEAESAGRIPALRVRHFHIQEAALDLDDHTRRLPLHVELTPINIAFTNLTTRADQDTPYRIVVSSDTFRQITWQGTLQVAPFEFHGRFVFEDGRLGRTTPIVRDYARLEVADGRLDAQLEFHLAAGAHGLSAIVTNSMVQVSGLKIRELNTDEFVSTLDLLRVSHIEMSLLDRSVHVGSIQMEGMSKVVRLEEDGSLNFNSVLELPEPAPASTNAPAPDAESWTISLDEFALDKSVVSFTDLSRGEPFHSSLGPIQFRLTDFSTRSGHDAQYEFSVVTESGESVSGAGTVSAVPAVRSRGRIRVVDLSIPKYEPYYAPFLRGQIVDGRVGVDSDYELTLADGAPSVTTTNAGVTIANLKVDTTDPNESVLALDSLVVAGTRFNLKEQAVVVGSIRSSGGHLEVRQNEDGTINLLSLLPETPVESEDAAADREVRAENGADPPLGLPPAVPWEVAVEEIDFQNWSVAVEDRKPAQPARIELDQLRFNFQDITLRTNAPIAVAFGARDEEGGTVAVEGTVELFPPRADLTVEVKDLGLPAIQPYLEEHARLTLAQGRLQTRGRMRFETSRAESNGPMLAFSGDVAVTDFVTKDQSQGHELVQWQALKLNGIDFTARPNKLSLEEIRIEGFQASAIVAPDGQINLVSVLPPGNGTNAPAAPAENLPPPADTQEPEPEPSVTDLFPVEVGALVLDQASFKFVDQSISPAFTFVVEEMGGSVRGLATRADAVAAVDLTGRVSEGAPFVVRGNMQPLAGALNLDLTVTFTNTDLTAFTPYMEKYAGHPMNKGTLNMALKYDIQDNQLSAENRFQVAQLTLGPRNDSADATDLPVKLAVALLKDRRGNIEVDVPLSGSLDDPQFDVVPVVTKTIIGLIAKAATSPFSLLSAALGGGTDGEELSFVSFEPARAEIKQDQADKLDKLIGALYERPALNLEIAGQVDPVQDKTALAQSKLAEHVEAFRRLEMSSPRADTNAARPLLSPPRGEEGWLAAYFFHCAATNSSLLPETNLVAMLAAIDTAPATNLTEVADAPPSASEAETSGSSRRSPFRRHPSFSTAKGASLLRDPWSKRGAADAESEGQAVASERPQTGEPTRDSRAALGGPPSPEEIATRLGLSQPVMTMRLAETIPVTEEELRDLMRRRAKAVEAYLLQSERIARERLMVVTPTEEVGGATSQSRVELSLN